MKTNFVGSKGGAGIAQWIISAMPAHRVYVEAFLGTGVVLRTKRRAEVNFGIEADREVLAQFWKPSPGLHLMHGDAVPLLREFRLAADCLVYLDPPYLASTRLDSSRDYYGAEFKTEWEHAQLLRVLVSLNCYVMISSYPNGIYSTMLPGWRMLTKQTTNRAGKTVLEALWCNFPPPLVLHDARFLGADYTRRQGVKRLVSRWKRRFLAMEASKRCLILNELTDAQIAAQPELAMRSSQSGTAIGSVEGVK